MKLHTFLTTYLTINFASCNTIDSGNDYDFIIVGAGSAGSVIASRLSENLIWKILLLEAGDEGNLISSIPTAVSLLPFTKYNWGHFMEVQPNLAQSYNDNRMPWHKGRGLGGTSLINYMIYTRGNRFNYDQWAAQGNPGWSYADVLPYFIKSENCSVKNADYAFHGVDGYLGISEPFQTKITDVFLKGLHELGLPFIDYNSNKTLGASPIQANIFQGRRHTSADAFLKPVKHRFNLHIKTRAFARKVLIDEKTKHAFGVEYEVSGKIFKAMARKEVILSAGVINSPQLLMLSGIGPKQELGQLGISVLKDLQVGRNLQDNLAFLGLNFVTPEDVTLRFSKFVNLVSIYEVFESRTGPWVGAGGAQAIAYIKTDESEELGPVPDMELLLIGGSLSTDYGLILRTGMNIRDDVYNSLFAPTEGKNSFMIFLSHLTPKSKGYIKLRSADPHDYPLMYGNYFTDPGNKDINTFLAAVRYVQKLIQTETFKKFKITLIDNPVPGCTHHQYDSDDYWRCFLRSLIQTFNHQVGTAKMGPKNDPDAVVNHKLEVYGVKGLRVADCSVIPFALSAHTNAPAMMVGEKAADIIKNAWKDNLW
ncbi:Glucose dehydrogenase [FAD, quinone]-like Protein [Tribolium castaneum]|uniref:Glucose dehydrogenase [FAD, quinone]-like Protein n=1 Tax=Tribolium castaneum TaxID=7070 RepID=D2A183_TRICA|nr:PREDICTED: glucose dehydrogenase [FAD, quinone] [Tribolium castaneum]EFA02628.2 Glucose dehydrogenase [FAD, quinone]-like Protein [Tribolium castaneum]|eukprot:XP_008192683.1 PREDICTED: glucose dehydrogenase [FAD, quinone] [Tribolium castaneum]